MEEQGIDSRRCGVHILAGRVSGPVGRGVSLVVALTIGAADSQANVIQVTTMTDSEFVDGQCSLREALVAANTDTAYLDCTAGNGADEIEVTVEGTLTLSAALPSVEGAVTLRGLGPERSSIDGGGAFGILRSTDAGAGADQPFRVEGFLLTGGHASYGGAIDAGRDRTLEVFNCHLSGNQADLLGGAIRADLPEQVLIEDSWFEGNSAGASGGGLSSLGGSLIVRDSTFSGNVAGASAGGLHALQTTDVLLERSTFSGNMAAGEGGGVAVAAGGTLEVESSTIFGNTTDSGGSDNGDGGGVAIAGPVTATLTNTLLAGNIDATVVGSVCPNGSGRLGADFVSAGFNLVGANDCIVSAFPDGQPNLAGDQVGTSAAPIDPLLETLDDFGGFAPTHLPLPGSPAIDQGGCGGDLRDQRGYTGVTGYRIVDDLAIPNLVVGCDTGAVELGAFEGRIFSDDLESGASDAWSQVVP